jgi:Ser/Thr protein kinase RdoA (MazF antagonist)
MVSHDARLQHLITLAEGALACYDLQGTSLTLLSETANAVFHVAMPSGRPQRMSETASTRDGAEYALRLCPPHGHGPQTIAEELQWLLALRRDTDLVVPEPVPACDGTLVREIRDPDTPVPWQGVLFHWVPGERRTETLTPPDLERVGMCMARLHQHAAAFVTAQHPPLTRRARFCDVLAWRHGFKPAVAVYSPRDLAVFAAAAQWVHTACQALEEIGHGVGFIHADMHQWNYLFHGEEVRVIDFDDCGWGYYAYDMAVTLTDIHDREDFAALRQAFLTGYTRVQPLPPGCEPYIKHFGAARVLFMLQWLLGRSHPECWEWGEAYIRNAVGRLECLLADATIP